MGARADGIRDENAPRDANDSALGDESIKHRQKISGARRIGSYAPYRQLKASHLHCVMSGSNAETPHGDERAF
jgi:hypothetical protein